MNLRALHYLVTLADVRHFSKAAEQCYVSQPTLSTQIRKLEEELDVQLVERAPRQVMLTRVGEEIVERARAVLGEVDAIRAIARRSRDPHSGTLRLGIFPTLAPYLLPHVIPRMRQDYPRLTLRLFEEKTEDILAMLEQGRLDAGVLALPVHDDQLVSRVLFEEPFVVAMPESHPLASKRSIDMSDLESAELLLLEDGHCLRDQALEVCQMSGAHEKLDFHATSMETLRQMVAANTGITLMPTLAVKPPVAPTENLLIRPFTRPGPKRTIAMVWRKSSALSEFLCELSELFASIDPALLEP
ncbi:LysR substrate-binding domain-containing protein [Wenzhouxiangella marina]|uniref:Transcriptional regulator n=1 Tax=Wenzhouxiangella marina TaxID=1579979 RepID=A0A0K0XWP0_9GAMM|nr:LysR substrate-binding domain-containing protein [Wenzhouxiangella marina]AKS42119.1 transcriptional regulator [Wenzhouxiangella marina]MBB6086109.1 LysR family hydrogen peroxide-inducible transcriptional activator [Wenzhouxiangella marina]